MNKIKSTILALSMFTATSAGAGECSEYFKVKSAQANSKGGVTYSVKLTKEAKKHLTDSTTAKLDSCFIKLLHSSPEMSIIRLNGKNINLQELLED